MRARSAERQRTNRKLKSAEGLTIGLCVVFFVAIALLARGEATQFDREVLLAMRTESGPVGPAWLLEAARSVTALGGHTVLAILVLLVAVYLLLSRDNVTAGFVVIAAATGTTINTLLKALFDRARPDFVTHLTDVVTASFPSGHAALSAIVYLTLGALLAGTHRSIVFRIYFIGVAIFLVILIGLSRIYLGVHYPTDVLAGWCFGTAWALVCWLILKALQQRRVARQPDN
jgi:undecaprenyl-diphosphatase